METAQVRTAIWDRLGLIAPPVGLGWAKTHVYVPTPYLKTPDTIRLFSAFWDDDRVGRLGYVDVDAADPVTVRGYSSNPVLDVGRPGKFDEFGVTPISLATEDSGALRLYYVGWQRLQKGKYTMLMGAARSSDQGDSFTRILEEPVLPETAAEANMRTAGFVLRSGNSWKMWYAALLDWTDLNGKLVPTSELRYVESNNGIDWPDRGIPLSLPRTEKEYGFGRPYVFFENGAYRMWFSYRHTEKFYRIGYAESVDGINWRRDDTLGLDVSESGWDSQMTCFPALIQHQDQKYLFYNGNEYGKDGCGVARLAQSVRSKGSSL